MNYFKDTDFYKMLKYLAVAVLLTLFVHCTASAQSFQCKGTNYSSVSTPKQTTKAEKTPYTWTDSKGQKYDIYISKKGSCFIQKISSKTGKEYKQYLKPDVSQDICQKMGREYKHKSNI